MKGFLAGIAVTILALAVFPSLGHWAMAMPYRALAAVSRTAGNMPAGWQGRGYGARTAYGCPGRISVSEAD